MGLSAPLFTTRSPSRSRTTTCETREPWVAGMAAGIRIRLRRIVQNHALDARERQISNKSNSRVASAELVWPRSAPRSSSASPGHAWARRTRHSLCRQKIKKIARDSFSFGHEQTVRCAFVFEKLRLGYSLRRAPPQLNRYRFVRCAVQDESRDPDRG